VIAKLGQAHTVEILTARSDVMLRVDLLVEVDRLAWVAFNVLRRVAKVNFAVAVGQRDVVPLEGAQVAVLSDILKRDVCKFHNKIKY
jgi:hypothetical protein